MSADTKNLIEAISTIVQSVVAVSLLVVAIYGVNEWRRHMVAEKQYEAVRQLLLLARQFHARFGKARELVMYVDGERDRPRDTDETPEETQIPDVLPVRWARLQLASDLFPELRQLAWEVEIATEEKVMPLIKPFEKAANELRIALKQWYGAQVEAQRIGQSYKDLSNQFSKAHQIVVHPSPTDELNQSVDNVVEELEQKLRKYIR